MAAVAFAYSNYLLLHWQLLILVVFGFLGSVTFFMAEALAESSRRESDYDCIWGWGALRSWKDSPGAERIPASRCGAFRVVTGSVWSLAAAAGTKYYCRPIFIQSGGRRMFNLNATHLRSTVHSYYYYYHLDVNLKWSRTSKLQAGTALFWVTSPSDGTRLMISLTSRQSADYYLHFSFKIKTSSRYFFVREIKTKKIKLDPTWIYPLLKK